MNSLGERHRDDAFACGNCGEGGCDCVWQVVEVCQHCIDAAAFLRENPYRGSCDVANAETGFRVGYSSGYSTGTTYKHKTTGQAAGHALAVRSVSWHWDRSVPPAEVFASAPDRFDKPNSHRYLRSQEDHTSRARPERPLPVLPPADPNAHPPI